MKKYRALDHPRAVPKDGLHRHHCATRTRPPSGFGNGIEGGHGERAGRGARRLEVVGPVELTIEVVEAVVLEMASGSNHCTATRRFQSLPAVSPRKPNRRLKRGGPAVHESFNEVRQR